MYIMDGFYALRPEDLVSSTAPGDAIGVWDAGTTYYKGALVYGADGATVYECAVGPATYLAGSYCGQKYGVGLDNVGNNPDLYPTVPAMDRTAYPDYTDIDDCYKESGLMWWIKRGEYWENKYRMFQESPDLITEAEGSSGISSFSVTCTARQAFKGFAFFRVVATSITISAAEGTLEIDMLTGKSDIPGGDVYTRTGGELEFEIGAGSEFTVTFTHDMSKRTNITARTNLVGAACGFMACGTYTHIGLTLYQTSLGIRDYSRKERDAFGRAIVTQREYTNIISYKVAIDTEDIYPVTRWLGLIRATLSVYGGLPGNQETLTVGYFKDFSIPIDSYTQSIFTLEVEGL